MVILVPIIVLSLLRGPGLAEAAKDGVIGFGISLYQDLCCQACHDSLASLYLACTTFDHDKSEGAEHEGMGDMGMAMMGETSEECRSVDTAWLQTMAFCIQQNCDVDGYPAEKQDECFSAYAVAGASEPTLKDSLPVTAPMVELSADAVWLNETSLVNRDIYYSTHGTYEEFTRSEYSHTRYSVMLYFLVIGACLLCGVSVQTASRLPGFQKKLRASRLWCKLQQHIILPALFGSRSLEPLPGQVGYLPSRLLSIFIGLYIILNIVFSAVSFRSFQPNIWFLSLQFEICEYVGNRTGTLSLVNMSIAILFAGRNNFLIALTGWNQTTFMVLHRWTARVAAVQAVVHSIVYTLAYFEPGYGGAVAYAAKAAEPFYWWGIIATIAMCLAVGVALFPIRQKLYEFFLLTHIAMVILALVGCWYHLVPHFGFDYGYQVWLYIAFAFWSADRLARLVRVTMYNPLRGSRAVIQGIPDCDIMQLTVFPRTIQGFGPAQHSFLYFPGLGKFWENHPFSVAGWESSGRARLSTHIAARSLEGNGKDVKLGESYTVASTAEEDLPPDFTASKNQAPGVHETQAQGAPCIKFLIHARSGMTSSLRHRLLSSPSSALELSVYTEGPYAGHRATLYPLFSADTILCIAGGIGITHILGFIQQYYATVGSGGRAKSRSIKARRFILAWSAREMTLIEHVRCNFLTDHEGAEYSFWCTAFSGGAGKVDSPAGENQSPNALEGCMLGTAVKTGRMDIASVLRSSAEHGQQTAVLVCAPGGMADEVTKQTVRCVRDGLRVELIKEVFAW
ncbi:ferric reductase like transmembrane component-domain-containing protein [Lasiosphaeria hispida]|uniref:Ferric reductase like transmembrane component-domain-containing protein n=1 Tax=Lasiosphaeria hispida TaxID=260671 RepID=A0AAJ0M9Y7_9PEZI|nr:ferric reductase like transmembrane component-domain-containing protein [Lasiosphaeria hispida]